MKKSGRAIYLSMLITISVNMSKAHAQKMIFSNPLSNNKIAEQSSVFNIDDQSRIVTMLLYNGDVPFTSTKLVFKFYEVNPDNLEKICNQAGH